jgi:hypothetical protein
MNKLIILFTLLFLNNIIAQDKKPVVFISSAGSTYREADVISHNVAYMNGLKVVQKKITKSGDIWVAIVKTEPRH